MTSYIAGFINYQPIIKLKRKLTQWLFTPYHLVIRNQYSFAEKIPFNFSPAKLLICVFLVTVTFTSLGLLLSNTILRKWLNPAYIEQANKDKLNDLYASLEKLAKKNELQDNFITTFQNALTGKGEAVASDEGGNNEPLPPMSYQEDNQEFATQEAWSDITNKPNHHYLTPIYAAHTSDTTPSMLANNAAFVPPVAGGVITTPFNTYEHYGLDIVGKANEPIKSIADGKVILASFTVETGWVILIQHDDGVLSTYKHNAVLLKQQNDTVKKGEAIALMGNSGELTTGPHLHFELWHEGRPINPEDIIKF